MKTITPGPWKWIGPYCLYGAGGREVLTTMKIDMRGEPDAYLLAAAPGLLARLYQCLGYLEANGGPDWFIQEVRETIAQAEGEKQEAA